MILEVMQRKFVENSATEVEALLRKGGTEKPSEEFRHELKGAEVDFSDVVAAGQWIESLKPRLAAAPKDDAAWFPNDKEAAAWQSALQRYFIDRGLVQGREGAGAGPVTHPISDITLNSSVTGNNRKKLFGAMSESDIRWASCLFAKSYRRIVGGRHSFPDQAAVPLSIANDSRIFLVADWGSGVSRARKLSQRIRSMMLAGAAKKQHVIHLGDVYYSGWPEEYDDHFLDPWPVHAGEESSFGSWCLNANHDMFSGGHGYFDHLLADGRFKRQERKSYFSLETEYWLILGLDSAWEEGGLAGNQSEWVERRMRECPGKKLLLLTHHQPFSSFGEGDHPDLQRLLERNAVTAWFWGHEHRFAIYKPRPKLKYGRLIGHGGVPVWVKAPWKFWNEKQPEDVEFVSSKGFQSGFESFLLFGFAVLDFAGDKIQVQYVDEYGGTKSEVMR